jgi:uncharacterized membrane protein YraQ (UPF0718 family)
MTYLFSAPVINPLVLAATYVAFRGNLRMVLARVFVVAACACVMGAVAGKHKPDFLLRKGSDSDDHGHLDHEPAAAQLSFMALGPMVDLKLIFMYGSVFRKRFVLLMIVLSIICVYLPSLLTASGVKI